MGAGEVAKKAGLGILDILSRPRNAVVEGVKRTNKEISEGDYLQAMSAFLSGVPAGLSGKAKPGIADIFTAAGVGRNTMNNPAVKYGKYALDFGLDPLLLAPMPGKGFMAKFGGSTAHGMGMVEGAGRHGDDITRALDELLGEIPVRGQRPGMTGAARQGEGLFKGVPDPHRPLEEQFNTRFMEDLISGEFDDEALARFADKVKRQKESLPEYQRKITRTGRVEDAEVDLVQGFDQDPSSHIKWTEQYQNKVLESPHIAKAQKIATIEHWEDQIIQLNRRGQALGSLSPKDTQELAFAARQIEEAKTELSRIEDYIQRGGQDIWLNRARGLPPANDIQSLVQMAQRNSPVSIQDIMFGFFQANQRRNERAY